MFSLKISEISLKDAGKAIARLNTKDMTDLGLSSWDLIEIEGKRKTVTRVMPLDKSENNKSIIKIDGITRQNAKASVDDHVFVKKVDSRIAIKAVLTPVSPEIIGTDKEAKFILNRLDGMPITVGDRIRVNLSGAKPEDFNVIATVPAESVILRSTTKLEIKKRPKHKVDPICVTFEDVGGLGEQIKRVREIVELPLRYPQLFEKLGIDPPRGLLLVGPPGCGKTLLAKAVAQETNTNFQVINGPEIIHKFYGESEARLRDIFEVATRNQPSIIFIDEIDAIARKRDKVTGDVEKRVVSQLLALMDGLKDRGQIIVLAATNLPNLLDPALRRPGRFDREVALEVPDRNGRHDILQIHTRGMPLDTDVDLDKIADLTHGYVGADLENLCKESAIIALRKVLPEVDLENGPSNHQQLFRLKVSNNNFLEALKEIEPSAIREIFVEVPKITWDDVGGLDEVKDLLRESIMWPIKYSEVFDSTNTRVPKGILLHGPPGTGKTLVVKAIANESGINFISVKGSEVLSKFVGESEQAVRELFKKAKQVSPCILFFDEIDALAPCRLENSLNRVSERIVSQLLTEMDGIEELRGVFIVAATNRPDMIDPALLRSGRFDAFIQIPVPNEKALYEILKVHTKGKPLAKNIKLREICKELKGFSGADVELLCSRASLISISEYIKNRNGELKIKQSHFDSALEYVKKKVKAVS
ncbi:MAG: CDC48 family AAA ATPase [Candidatus Dadabacteria bacterium]|nr:CDC48 family AAA ATPase [Candidatus Dadabacteria bacterium]NIV41768.1 CDC48 family AAA ATPase [Candidatus Dadabacteria bacterium]NIX14637.1 CDC48 family AAA ATPase [Candidatus Dadabacteria bacterium]